MGWQWKERSVFLPNDAVPSRNSDVKQKKSPLFISNCIGDPHKKSSKCQLGRGHNSQGKKELLGGDCTQRGI